VETSSWKVYLNYLRVYLVGLSPTDNCIGNFAWKSSEDVVY